MPCVSIGSISQMGNDETRKDFAGLPFDDTEGCIAAVGQSDDVDDPEAFCAWLEDEGKEALSDPQAEEILTGLEVEFVSAVDTPAQDSEWLIAKNAEDPRGDTHRWQSETPLLVRKGAEDPAEKDEDDVKQIAFAPVLVPGEADKQGDVIPSHEIEKAAHKYLAEYRKVDSDHDLLEGKGTPVESWTLKQDTAFDLPGGDGSRECAEGTWVMGIKFDDETWSRVVEGELNGLSIYGGARPLDADAILGDDRPQEASASAKSETAKGKDESMKNEDDESETTDSTSKQDVDGSSVSAILGAYKEYVGDGSAKANEATVEDFVKYLLENDKVSEDEVKNLDVFLGVGDKADDEEDDGDEDEDDEDDEEGVDLDVDDPAKSEDEDADDVDKGADDGTDEDDDVEKSTDEDPPAWAEGLVDRVEDLEKKVDDIPSSPRMDVDENDRLATIKSVFGVEDDEEAEVIRKGIVEQADADDDGGVEISFDGITDTEDADASASGSSTDSTGQGAAANSRMKGLND